MLFYKNYIIYYNVYCYYCGVFIESMCVIGYCVSELHGHICNVLPEAVYCCFTRITLFTKLFTCLYDQSLRLLSHHQTLLLYTLWFLRYNVAKCIAQGCLLLFYIQELYCLPNYFMIRVRGCYHFTKFCCHGF